MKKNIKAVTVTSSNFGQGEQPQETADTNIIKKSEGNNNTVINSAENKNTKSKQRDKPKKNLFRKLFKKIHSPDTDTIEATGIDPNDKLISRTQFIVMSGVAPCTFHAVLQKLPNFPKVREIRRRQNFYSVTEVNEFLTPI